jgi:hypothetical protein
VPSPDTLVGQSCPVDGAVERCTFVGMGRGWAGGGKAASCLDFAAGSELSWRPFEMEPW